MFYGAGLYAASYARRKSGGNLFFPNNGTIAAGGDLIMACPAGTGPNANRDGCVPCPAGLYSLSGSGCRPCAEGWFAPMVGSTTCQRCASGTFTPPLAPSRDSCLSDRSVARGLCNAQGRSACVACAPGTFAPQNTSTACVPCGMGQYTTSQGAYACTDCPAGTYSAAGGASSAAVCLGCLAAQDLYSAAGASSCIRCAGGIVNPNGSLCVGCGLGRYEAPSNPDNPAASLSMCFECPAGLVQLQTSFAEGANACVPCPLPTIQVAVYDTPRQLRGQACLNVSGGYVASRLPNGGATAAAPCPGGTYRSNDGMLFWKDGAAAGDGAVCTPCALGSWSAPAAAACTPCAPG